MRTAILMRLTSMDDCVLECLARERPPFGSWTSEPSEDAWLDPADEIFVDPADRFDWEEQVGIMVALSVITNWYFSSSHCLALGTWY